MSDHAAHAEATANSRGLIVVLPGDEDLFIDIDDAESMAVFDRNIEIVKASDNVIEIKKTPSPSGKDGRFHIVVTLGRPIKDALERIMMQALLGSDRLHETLSWQGAVRGDANPTLFFEKPTEVTP